MLGFPESSILSFFFNSFFLFSNNIDRFFFPSPDYKFEAVWDLLVVSKLNGATYIDTSEGVWKDLPVPDRVAIETHSRVGILSRAVCRWAEVILPDFGDVVVMKIDDLQDEVV